MEIKKVEKGFGWKRNLDYFNVNFMLMWKNTIEYKTNFYLSISNLIVSTIIQIFTFSMLSYVFLDYINWEPADYLLFYILTYLISTIAGFFSWGKELRFFLIGSLLIPLLRGYEYFFNPVHQILLIILLIIFFDLGTYLLWYYGLKKYEAFG